MSFTPEIPELQNLPDILLVLSATIVGCSRTITLPSYHMANRKPRTILESNQLTVTKTPPLIDCSVDVSRPKFMPDEEIAKLTLHFSDLWNYTSDAPPPIGRTYTPQQQRENEQKIEGLLLEADRQSRSRNGIESHIGRLRDSVRDLVLESVDVERREQIADMLIAFSNAGDEFVRRTKEFDESLRFDGIFQALRNLWIINSMQEAFGLPICVNPSGLAYSLLYTYTDNYLDAGDISRQEKEDFGRIFGRRLAGFDVPEDSPLISKISALVRLIETEYHRTLFPGVFDSLLAIHHAQRKSLRQRGVTGNDSQSDILSISVEKGGASVIADAYVAKGRLSSVEKRFAFGYGVFLQFIDDLQDVREDLREGSETLFTRAAKRGTMDSITNRLFRYLREILFSATSLNGSRANALMELILQGSLGLILESIALNPGLFSVEYVKAAELFSPLGFASIRRLHTQRAPVERNFNLVAAGLDSETLKQMTLAATRKTDGEFAG